jgi:hypothetical protein
MKPRLSWWLPFPLLLAGFCAAQQQPPSFSLAISTPHSVVKAGQAVPLTIVITNTSDREIYYAGALNLPGAMYVHVVDGNNKPAAETPYGRTQHGTAFPPTGSGSVLRIDIAPGESMKEEVMVDKEWDISQPGIYTMQVEKSDSRSNTTVKSSVIALTVQ